MINNKRLKELSEFLNLDLKTLKKMDRSIQDLPGFAKWVNVAVEDWVSNKINQNQKEAIEGWFKNNDKYIFELSDVHSRIPKQKIIKQVTKIAKKYGVKSIIDYGGGIGEEVINYTKGGMKASMADLPTLTFDYAKWRAKKYNLKIKFIPIVDEHNVIDKKYDAITCFEVLQHLYDPIIVASEFIDHLKEDGLLFLTTRFINVGYPIALRKNEKWDEGLISYFSKNGLTLINQIYQYGEGERAKYLYVYKKISKKKHD